MPKKTTKKTAVNKKNTLVIVESPTKIRTIKKVLGSGFEVMSSKGHIRDLPASKLGVDIPNGFTPEYVVSRKDGKAALLKELKTEAAKCKNVYLATDPDREGEAIAWHLANLLGLDTESNIRVTFDEITEKTIKNRIKEPTHIDKDLVNSQQARRVLDRIVGYKLSPFLWKKVKRGLSAGRVQSVATRMVVDREREIEAFVPQEFWNLDAVLKKDTKSFIARFYGKSEKMSIDNEQQLKEILDSIDGAEYIIDKIRRQQKTKLPRPPFTTSSLQQEASVRLNMRPQKTMSVAQSLYEGVDIQDRGLSGLITYMRTDSLRISDEARFTTKDFILQKYGEDFYPQTPRIFKTKSTAQDAHEAIRPTDVTLTPEVVKGSLTSEQFRLYKLIWERFVASQMASAVYDTVSVDVKANDYIFRASDSKITIKGFTVLYNYEDDDDEDTGKLPPLEEGDKPQLTELKHEQKFTPPPPRYTEASLIKALEENGIGRPSTYAPTISTIIERDYVEKKNKILIPTQMGFITTDVMTENFKDIVDLKFTADMEEKLDKIEHGDKTYLEVLNDFYGGFEKTLEDAEKNMENVRIKVPDEVSDVTCELCGAKMVYKNGRFGRFLACPNFPECRNTKAIINYTDGTCPKCGSRIVVRRSPKGKTYYACEKPREECGFMSWDAPTKDLCPKCGKTLFKGMSRVKHCLNEACGYTEKKKTDEKS
ncbi:MAG: type I DNA topoisomerase [Clostridiales bacterium]|nr:MAG: type I DNA topoisomerase [Clostridiales bacterium]